MAGGGGGTGCAAFGVGQFVVFFPLHPSVLKPDLNLPLREAQRMGDFNPAPPGQVPVKVKFLFQFKDLLPGVSCARALWFSSCVVWIY